MAKKRYKFGGEWIEVDETPGEGKTKKFTARATGEKYSEPQKTSIGVAPSITKQYQTLERENERKLTGRERENNRLYSAYESEIKGELSRAAVRNPLVASEIIRADERQRKESAQRMGETAAVTSYLRSEQSKIPYTQASDAGKLVKTGDTVKVMSSLGEGQLEQLDKLAEAIAENISQK